LSMGLDGKEEDGRRHKITEYSLRRFVKTTISNAGYHDFSEWHIGHKHSEYWNTDDEQKIGVFKEIEPRLTFLDTKSVEAHTATVESKLQASEERLAQLQQQQLKQQQEKENDIARLKEDMEELRELLKDPKKLLELQKENQEQE
jgi:DNA primase